MTKCRGAAGWQTHRLTITITSTRTSIKEQRDQSENQCNLQRTLALLTGGELFEDVGGSDYCVVNVGVAVGS